MFSAERLNIDTLTLWFFFDIVIKSAAFLGLIAVIAWQLRHRSAATLHRLWALAFCGLIIIPLVSPLLPRWSLAVMPREYPFQVIQPASIPIAATTSSLYPKLNKPHDLSLQADHAKSGRSADVVADQPSQESLVPNTPATGTADAVQQVAPSRLASPQRSKSVTSQDLAVNENSRRIRISALILLTWLAGFSLCALRIARDQIRIRKILARSEPLTDTEWTDALRVATEALRIKRPVELRKISAAFSPMIAGILHPVVIIPNHMQYKESSNRGLILLHELAHLQRSDVLSQSLAQWLCAAYWFNPIAWYGLAQLRKYRELACDDQVLEVGQRPSEYAQLLLEVARQQSQSTPKASVCMARGTDVEHRILAILDHLRSHIPLSRRAAQSLLLLTTFVVALFASMRLQSRTEQLSAAEKPEKQAAPKKTKNDKPAVDEKPAAGQFRKMVVVAKDEQGKPLPEVEVSVSVWEMPKAKRTMAPNTKYRTGQDGKVEVTIPNELCILRMFLSPTGYVPVYVNMDRGRSNIGPLLPPQYEFVLEKSTEIGGRLVDLNGQPIAGARVSLGVNTLRAAQKEDTKVLSAQPQISINESDYRTTTDDNGRWKFDMVPRESSQQQYEFRVRFEHQNYGNDFYVFGGDQNYVGMKKGHGVTLPMLRSGDAKIVMERGASISGTVTNIDGKPVTKGAVTWKEWL